MGKAVDISGQKFGELTAIEPTDKRVDGKIVWRCVCSCGKDVFATARDLRSGNTKSCGCSRVKNLVGQRFGRLVVLSRAPKSYRGSVVWHCRCDCGKETDVPSISLRSGNTKSCGCLNHERRPTPSDVAFGTRISALGSNPPKSNTSGVRGVSWSRQKQDWEAYIKFRGKFYHLGHYKSIEDAAKARAEAEEKFYSPAKENFDKIEKG